MIELVIVMLVVGVVGSIAIPAIVPDRSAAEEGAQVVTSTLLMAQRKAVVEQRNVIVRFDQPEQALVVHLDEDHDEKVDSDEQVWRVHLGEGVRLGTAAPPRAGETPPVTFKDRLEGMPAVTFRRNGSASEAGAIYLMTRTARAVDSRLVELTRATGRAEIYRYTDAGWLVRRAQP